MRDAPRLHARNLFAGRRRLAVLTVRAVRVCASPAPTAHSWPPPEALLDIYHFERHPVGSDLLKHTLAQTALIATFSLEGLALRDMLAELVNHTPALSERLATTLSGLGVACRLAEDLGNPGTELRAAQQQGGRD
ncbi:hypothetical protein ACWCO9_01500 [Streptomyces sp. NPDC001937]